jgi:hypothetical protein
MLRNKNADFVVAAIVTTITTFVVLGVLVVEVGAIGV